MMMNRRAERNSGRRKAKESSGKKPVKHEKFHREHKCLLDQIQLSPEQVVLDDILDDPENDLVLAIGPAGNGKTLCILQNFCKQYIEDPTLKIIVIRSPGEAGPDTIGFLPGDLDEKIAPHFYDDAGKLKQLLGSGKFENDLGKRIIFMVPNFSTGITLDNALILIDDAQMLTPVIMYSLVTRIGKNSRCVVAGDHIQQTIDNKKKDRTGLNAIAHALIDFRSGVPYPRDKGVDYFEFSGRYNMRSSIVKTVTERWKP